MCMGQLGLHVVHFGVIAVKFGLFARGKFLVYRSEVNSAIVPAAADVAADRTAAAAAAASGV